MTDNEFSKIVHELLGTIKSMTPRATGNLADKSTKVRASGANEMRVFVDAGSGQRKPMEGIAPYFWLVNYRRTYPVKTPHGVQQKENRNYHYYEKAVETAIERLATKIGGDIVKK